MEMCANWLHLEHAHGSLIQSFLFGFSSTMLLEISSISRSLVISRRTDPPRTELPEGLILL